MEVSEITAESWYPKGIATGLKPAEGAPSGFAKFRLSTRWGSHDLFHPKGTPASSDWWAEITSDSGWWGEAPDISGTDLLEIKGEGRVWRVSNEINEFEIRCLPLDNNGHAKVLAGLDCEHLFSAICGLQYNGVDILIVLPIPRSKTARNLISELVKKEDQPGLNHLAERIGIALGRFASSPSTDEHKPNTQRRWNNQLKKVEGWTNAKTLWRAPHAPETNGTITHRNLGLEVIHVDDDSVHFSGAYDCMFSKIIGSPKYVPAIRDLAAVFTSLGELLTELDAQGYEGKMRQYLLKGWSSKAPTRWSSSRALDTHRGGVAIWEYEQNLERTATAHALAINTPEYTRNWLTRVSRLQASMFADRTWSALSLVCWGLSAIIATLWLNSGISDTDGLAAIPLAIGGFVLRKMYNSRSQPPWNPL